jgi:hypothetical protein
LFFLTRPGFVNALIDGRGRELQPKPVAQELTDAGPRQAHALGQGADEGHQQRAGQMPLGQLHRPLGLGRAAPGLRLRPMATVTATFEIEVFDLLQHQPGVADARLDQIERVARVVRPLLMRGGQRLAAPRTPRRDVGALGSHRQMLGAAVPRRARPAPRRLTARRAP